MDSVANGNLKLVPLPPKHTCARLPSFLLLKNFLNQFFWKEDNDSLNSLSLLVFSWLSLPEQQLKTFPTKSNLETRSTGDGLCAPL